MGIGIGTGGVSFPDENGGNNGGSGSLPSDVVRSVNSHAGPTVNLTATDVHAEQARASGTIGGSTDMDSLAEGDYYVTEQFPGAPVTKTGTYTGVINVDLDFDQGNGGLMTYTTGRQQFFKLKYASNVWDKDWTEVTKEGAGASTGTGVNLPTAPSATLGKDSFYLLSVAQNGDAGWKAFDPSSIPSGGTTPEPSKHHGPPATPTFDSTSIGTLYVKDGEWPDADTDFNVGIGGAARDLDFANNPSKLIIGLPAEYDKYVAGIQVNNGLSAQWESKDIQIGPNKYTFFRSPYQFNKDGLTFNLIWR